jgi:hypothetical protein
VTSAQLVSKKVIFLYSLSLCLDFSRDCTSIRNWITTDIISTLHVTLSGSTDDSMENPENDGANKRRLISSSWQKWYLEQASEDNAADAADATSATASKLLQGEHAPSELEIRLPGEKRNFETEIEKVSSVCFYLYIRINASMYLCINVSMYL